MTLTAPAFDWVCNLVRTNSGIELQTGKEYLVEARLASVAREAGLPDVAAYVSRAQTSADRQTHDIIVESLTTNETSWFRDGGPFAALEKTILPELRRTRPGKSLQLWSAACSTGQEPYSLAMVLKETMVSQGWRCSIKATDFSPKVLEQAKRGSYSQIEMNRGLPANKLVAHFRKEGLRWTANDDLRNMITFSQINLAKPFPAMGQFDIVFLRNVLIYFSVETRRDILRRVRALCRPDGYLILGGAETTLGIDDKWTRVAMGATSVYQPIP